MVPTILWRRLDQAGHDCARLVLHDAQWHLTGTAVFAEAGQPCRLDYRVVCDSTWGTVSGSVAGWWGDRAISVEIRRDAERQWRLNDTVCPTVAGCIDLDLGFTPATNLLPIRRLGLAPGESAAVRAAWLGFPSLTLEPLEQSYRRTGEAIYAYESAGGSFTAELHVSSVGFVTRYPGLWESESAR